jgi:hypothetical protein
LQLRAEAGAVFAPGEARVPATALFRTGGDTTVRGYSLREIGAGQSDGSVAAGHTLAVASVEWLRPLRSGGRRSLWEQAFFIDTGAVADRAAKLRLSTGVGTGLRYASPVFHMRRTATSDTTVNGQAIKQGDKVVLWYAAGNRDESVFTDAERFDITRNQRLHLAFGTGQHTCIGNRLAEMQIALMFEALSQRFPNLRITGAGRRLRSKTSSPSPGPSPCLAAIMCHAAHASHGHGSAAASEADSESLSELPETGGRPLLMPAAA